MVFRKVFKMSKRNKKQVERKLIKVKVNIYVAKTVQINGLKHIETNLKQTKRKFLVLVNYVQKYSR